MNSIRHPDRPIRPASPDIRIPTRFEPMPDEFDRRPAWVRRLDDHIVVAPLLPQATRVERPVR